MDWSNTSVLVTGGTGTFGNECVTRLLERRSRRIVVFSRDETKQHHMAQKFGKRPNLRFFIGDVRDAGRVRAALEGIDVVIHAAALKHVPVCEYNPMEAVKTNVGGAQNLIEAAIEARVGKVVALSTDKCVAPLNLYGATKLVAEKLFIQGNCLSVRAGTRFSCTRYGNVVGSRGSVVEVFREQRASGVVRVTDRRMTRFVLTIRRGVEFVLESVERMVGGEVFVPKLPSVGIMDVVGAVAPECHVEDVGARPGEKLHEVLVSRDEARFTLDCGDYYAIAPAFPYWTMERVLAGNPVGEDFSYDSYGNEWRLGAEEFARMVEGKETAWESGQ